VAEGRWYGLWSVARQIGASAGGNAAGGSPTLAMPVPPYLVRAMGSQIASAGTIEEGSLPREALERLRREITDNAEAFRYAKSLLLECSKDSTRTANPESANLVAITETHEAGYYQKLTYLSRFLATLTVIVRYFRRTPMRWFRTWTRWIWRI